MYAIRRTLPVLGTLSRVPLVRVAASRGLASEGDSTYGQHEFLRELGIEEVNNGAFNGQEWVGHGNTHTAMDPSTGK